MTWEPDLQRRVLEILSSLPANDWLPDPSRTSVAPLSAGAYHVNFELNCGPSRAVVRLNRASQWGLTAVEQLTREYGTLKAVVRSGVTPRPLALIVSDPPLLVETFIEGEPFLYGEHLGSAARAIAAVHRQPVLNWERGASSEAPESFLLRDGLEWLGKAEANGSPKAVTSLLREAAQGLQYPLPPTRRCIIHTDLTANNMLVTTRGCSILDWEGARTGPPEWDLAYFLSPVTTRWAPEGFQSLSAEDHGVFLESYAKAINQGAGVITRAVERMLPLVIFRALCWCVGFEATEALNSDVGERLFTFTSIGFIERTLLRDRRSTQC